MGLKIWIEAARPKTLMAGGCPVILGTTLAFSENLMHIPSAIAALIGSLAIQIGTNYANDYFDFKKGADTDKRKGPRRATAAGLVKPESMKMAMIVAFAIAMLAGVYVMYRGGIPMLVIGVLSIMCGILYTGGPYPLGYNGLGDVFVLIFFGPVAVGGTYFIQAQSISWPVALLGIIPGLVATGILAINNLRDREEDASTGKRTLAVRFGDRFAKIEYGFCLVVPIALAIVMGHFIWKKPNPWLPIMALPIAASLIQKANTLKGSDLNNVLARTGGFLLVITILTILEILM